MSMDFVSDCLHDGRRFWALTIVDNVIRVNPVIEVGRALTGQGRKMRVKELGRNRKEKSPALREERGAFKKIPAATYFPTQLPMQYHRPRGA